MNRPPWLLKASAAVAAALIAAAVVVFGRGESAPREGSPAPALELADLDGQPAALTHYLGRVVLLDFWATWCEQCQEELPELKRIHGAYRGRGFELLAASVDAEGRKALVPFAGKNRVPWRILVADAASVRAYGILGLPTKFLIDRDGIIARKYAGPVEPAELERVIRTLIEKKRRT